MLLTMVTSSTISARVRQQLRHPSPALAVLREVETRAEQSRIRIDKRRAVVFEQLRGRQRAVEFRELRLVVEQFEVARRARHEQVDDVLCRGAKCGSGAVDLPRPTPYRPGVAPTPRHRDQRRTAAETSAARLPGRAAPRIRHDYTSLRIVPFGLLPGNRFVEVQDARARPASTRPVRRRRPWIRRSRRGWRPAIKFARCDARLLFVQEGIDRRDLVRLRCA